MKKLLSLLLGLILLSVPGHTSGVPSQALQAAQEFTRLLDDGNLQAAYWAGSDLLREANDELTWIEKIGRSQLLFGPVQKRVLKSSHAREAFPELPDNHYLLLLYHTQTSRKARAAEVILLQQSNGLWRISSYSIR